MVSELDSLPSMKPGVLYHEEVGNGGYVLIDLLAAKVLRLNEVGFYVLPFLGQDLSVSELARSIANKWGISQEKALADLLAFLNDLDSYGLILHTDLGQMLNEYWGPVFDENVRKFGVKYRPGLVYWEFTNQCNLSCRMCYNQSGIERPRETTLDDKLQILRSLRDVGTTSIVVTGGEPCTRKAELVPFLAECKRLGIAVEVFTNGTLLDDEIVDAFKANGVHYVRVSIHGARPETHDQITQVQGSFERGLRAARLLADAGIAVCWQMTASRMNFMELRDALDVALDLRLSGFRVGSLDLMGSGRDCRELQLSPAEEATLWRFLDEATIVYGSKIHVSWGSDFCMDEPWRAYVLNPPARDLVDSQDPSFFMRFCKSSLCGVAVRSIAIRADGMVIPCPAMAEVPLGDAKADFRAIWESSGVLQRLRRADLKGFPVCGRCGMRALCGAGCRANAFHLTGSVTGPDYRRCRGQEALREGAGLSGFFDADEIGEALAGIGLNNSVEELKWYGSVVTEGLGPWVPYWSVVARKWQFRYGGEKNVDSSGCPSVHSR
ncbi:MAG: PqqD family peptide modification chaperone [Bacillota bacterium]